MDFCSPPWESRWCSNLLSYASIKMHLTCFGGDERDRTADPLLARQVLSQLSYTPISVKCLHILSFLALYVNYFSLFFEKKFNLFLSVFFGGKPGKILQKQLEIFHKTAVVDIMLTFVVYNTNT